MFSSFTPQHRRHAECSSQPTDRKVTLMMNRTHHRLAATLALASLGLNTAMPLAAAQAAPAAQAPAAKPPAPAPPGQTAAGAAKPAAAKSAAATPDPDGAWPRMYALPSGASVLLYQPQIASWDKQTKLVAFSAVS